LTGRVVGSVSNKLILQGCINLMNLIVRFIKISGYTIYLVIQILSCFLFYRSVTTGNKVLVCGFHIY